ncbi:tetratricopeptide repeat protein [Solicola sp. PLA-1-18]|uniref:tetratricopeptide repeat protein n=1 Tax=Solicola sp. PLA-1-18 TaxID=3380532 RepID=UPI003B7F0F1A
MSNDTAFDLGALYESNPYLAFRAAEDLLQQRQPREAARVAEHVVEHDPDNAAAWELLGRARFAAAWLTPAEEAFRRLVELEPTSGWAHTALGLTLDRQSRHREGAVFHKMAVAMGEEPARPVLVASED